MRAVTLAILAAMHLTCAAAASEPIDNDFFERKVRPIFAANCVSCHGEKKQKGSLRLDLRAAFLKGGDNGPAVVPGEPDKSRLIKAIRYNDDLKMPLKEKLADADIAILTEWVKGGAPWPDDGAGVKAPAEKFDLRARAKSLWSFQPVRRLPVPVVGDARLVTNPVDAFLLARLRQDSLTFAPPAEKRVLLRRVYFDLIGLPPTPAEIDEYLKDESPEAYEKVVDKLLASPRYGERWGRHWLDLVRYAETHGHEFDFEIPDAWRYRDYVIRAFNSDVPYDQFLTEQIAGDLLSRPRRDPTSGVNESLTATGFWWLGEAKHSPVDSRAEYADRIDNQIDVFGKAVFGLTISCARCHDHKFDPISTRDYYSLFGILSSSRYNRADVGDPTQTVAILDELKQCREELAKLAPMREPDADAERVPDSDWRRKATRFELFNRGWRLRWDADGLALRPEGGEGYPHTGRESRKLTGTLRSPTFRVDQPLLVIGVAGSDAKARVILNGLQLIQEPIYGKLAQPINHGVGVKWLVFDLRMWKGQPAYLELLDDGPGWFAITEAWFASTAPPAETGFKVPIWDAPAGENDDAKKLASRIRELEGKIPGSLRAPAMRDGTAANERIFVRGNHKTPGIEAPRGTLEAFGKEPFATSQSGRLELARTATDPANPLAARVIVNRLWKHHFGEGLVRTPDDFGFQGEPPTHPELLDWLAAELVIRKWSLKSMHRLMVLSTAYRQASHALPQQAKIAAIADPLNKLVHRQNLKRLEAEAIRDSILAVSGRLDLKMGGPGVLPYLTEHQVGRGRPATNGPLDGNGRRGIYLQVRRNFINPMFTAFDYPTPFTTIGRRTVSNVPAQALVMLNNPFVLGQADHWAKRVVAAPGTTEERIRQMYLTAFAREPTRDELAAAAAFVKEQANEHGKNDHPNAWADLAHVLFNTKEFIFIE